MLDLEIVDYFFEHRDIGLLPKYTQYPVVDFLLFGSVPQSATEYLIMLRLLDLFSDNP